MRNAGRFTTADVVAAERVILAAAVGSRDGQGAAHVTPQAAALARSAVEAGQGERDKLGEVTRPASVGRARG